LAGVFRIAGYKWKTLAISFKKNFFTQKKANHKTDHKTDHKQRNLGGAIIHKNNNRLFVFEKFKFAFKGLAITIRFERKIIIAVSGRNL